MLYIYICYFADMFLPLDLWVPSAIRRAMGALSNLDPHSMACTLQDALSVSWWNWMKLGKPRKSSQIQHNYTIYCYWMLFVPKKDAKGLAEVWLTARRGFEIVSEMSSMPTERKPRTNWSVWQVAWRYIDDLDAPKFHVTRLKAVVKRCWNFLVSLRFFRERVPPAPVPYLLEGAWIALATGLSMFCDLLFLGKVLLRVAFCT